MPPKTGAFSASLRSRPDWAPAVPILLQRQHRDWKESKLETHDLALPLPGVGTISSGGLLRFLLLSATDMKEEARKAQTMQRIERLTYQDGSPRRCAIVFLLSAGHDQPDGRDGVTAFADLQIALLPTPTPIPILPLPTISTLPSLLEEYHDKLRTSTPPPLPPPPPADLPKMAARQTLLLPYSALRPPLPAHAVHVLGDINTSLGDLVDKISTPQGRTILMDYCEPEVVGRVVGFWTGESG